MEVRRFRWWEDEAAVGEEEGEEERRMAAKRRKRSIVELFAAVPQVSAGGGEGLGGETDQEESTQGGATSRVEAKKKGFKKDKVVVQIGVTKKLPAGATGLVMYYTVVLNYTSMVISFFVSGEKQQDKRKTTLLKDTGVMSPSNSLLKPKHVTFSDDNGILGQTASRLGDVIEKSQLLQASQQSYEDGKSQGSDDQHGTDEPQFTYKRTGAGLETVEEDTGSTVPLTKSKQKTILGNSVDLNHCLDMSTRGNCLSSISSAVSIQSLLKTLLAWTLAKMMA
ncbi:hypothetical protein GUJ93_ZPchr0628g40558 [Zizania palustris]|uniref:Uncharacterized protein n=1 Tax=Zizania palustris TaxID=103762 RepID=A0A8J5W066_ZIZPA|nr:hypothetical protein GUJ93_ZPchr0628g40558 [Zizania palustris]